MKISSISYYPYSASINKNFKQNKTFFIEEKNGMKNNIDNFTKNMFEDNKFEIINSTAQKTYNCLENNWLSSIDNLQRYKSAINKTEIFTKLAHTFHSAQKFDLAATALALALNSAEKNTKFESDEKKYISLVAQTKNLEILKDFFATSTNNQTKFYVMNAIREYKSAYFLPVAEDILEFDNDTVLYCDKKTTNKAREYLHEFYDFNLLRSAITKSRPHQNAVLNIINKWGIASDITILEKLEKNAVDNEIKAKCKNIQDKLKSLDKIPVYTKDLKQFAVSDPNKYNADIEQVLNEIIFKSSQNALIELKQYKYPYGTFNASRLIEKLSINYPKSFEKDLTKFIGQTSTFVEHLEFVKPNDEELSSLNNEKAEAYYKIMMRCNVGR